jgi:hypothetical protein
MAPLSAAGGSVESGRLASWGETVGRPPGAGRERMDEVDGVLNPIA